MTQLRMKDNSQKSKSEFSSVSKIVKKVADKTLEELEKEGIFVFPELVKETEDLTREQMILQSYNDFYRCGNVMGFLGYGDQRIIIESRFCTEKNDYFLRYLLERVLSLPNVINLEVDGAPDSKFFELFVFLFPHYLKRAVRKGSFKTYVHRKYNDCNPKGTIDIPRHIKINTPFVGNVAYSQRECSYDNDFTQLIRHTIEFIKKKPHGNHILSQAKDEVNLIVETTQKYQLYDKQKIIAENKKNVIRHAYFHEYRVLQHLCILILQNQKHQLGTGINRVYGILFDGAWLWEEYLNLLVKDLFYHPMNKGGKGAQRLFYGNIGLIYPDFISQNNDIRVIADAKYKPIGNIGNGDYFQMLAYMMRFNAKTGIYFYPETGTEEDLRLWLNTGTTYEKNVTPREDISVIKHGLQIPDGAKNYDDFSKLMRRAESVFRKTLYLS